MQFCPQCGTKAEDGTRFCASCGRALGEGSAEAAAPAAGGVANTASSTPPAPPKPATASASPYPESPPAKTRWPLWAGLGLGLLLVAMIKILPNIDAWGGKPSLEDEVAGGKAGGGNSSAAAPETPQAEAPADAAPASEPDGGFQEGNPWGSDPDGGGAAQPPTYNTPNYEPPAAQPTGSGAPIVVSPTELAETWRLNSREARGRYAGRAAFIAGRISRIDVRSRTPSVTLEGAKRFDSVILMFQDGSQVDIARLRPGQRLEAKCEEISDFGGMPILRRCSY